MQHALIAYADSTRLISIQARHDENFLGNLLLQLCQTMHIVQHCVLIITRAGTNDQQEAVVLARKNIFDNLVALQLQQLRLLANRIILH